VGLLEQCYRRDGRVGVVRLDRPFADTDSLVRFSGMLEDLRERVAWDEEVRCLVVRGPEAFSAGPGAAAAYAGLADLGPLGPPTPAAVLGSLAKPVIAAIEGDAVGPGLELALACDLRICSGTARLAMDHLAHGAFAVDGGFQRLARTVGRSAAMALVLLSEELSAPQALDLGLVHRVVGDEEPITAAMDIARNIGEMAPYAVRYVKEAVMRGVELPLAHGLRLEADLYLLLHSTADRTEGITAFREKRPPKFEGR